MKEAFHKCLSRPPKQETSAREHRKDKPAELMRAKGMTYCSSARDPGKVEVAAYTHQGHRVIKRIAEPDSHSKRRRISVTV